MAKDERFTAVVAEHRDRIYRMCCCYVRDEEARKDAYQQTLIHIWENLDSFQGRSQLSTWIYRITVNTCLGFLRAEHRRQSILSRETIETATAFEAAEDPKDTEQDVQLLYECINELPPLDRAIISFYLEDLSTREMADVLGISESNVRVKIHRIKKNLKASMERENNGSGQFERQNTTR
jgi:RNA polymerase sigma-70 factor (ECF subfamily)